ASLGSATTAVTRHARSKGRYTAPGSPRRSRGSASRPCTARWARARACMRRPRPSRWPLPRWCRGASSRRSRKPPTQQTARQRAVCARNAAGSRCPPPVAESTAGMVRCRRAPKCCSGASEWVTTGRMRSLRTVVAVLALLLLIAGTAFATRTSLDRHLSLQAASNQPSDSDGEKDAETEAPESEAPESEAPEAEAPESPDTNADTSESGTGAQLTDTHAAQ